MSDKKGITMVIRNLCILLFSSWIFICLMNSLPERLLKDSYFMGYSVFMFLALGVAGIIDIVLI